MDVLVTVLARNGAVITPAEQQEPEALLEAMHMPTAKLRQPTVIPRAKPDDLIRTTVDVPSHIGERTIPAGSQGLVLEANLSGSYLVDVTMRPATDTDDGDFDQATLTDGQFEVISAS